MNRKSVKRAVFLLIFGVCCSCSREDIPQGKILLKNDILDKEYNSFVVDQVITSNGLSNFHVVIKPGEKRLIPYKEVTSLRFARQYADHTKIYQVKCPAERKVGILMKLIDVHTNRLDGGCVLTKRGKSIKGGAVAWEE